ncbi:Glutathione S-transferase, C-terminal-like protein [Cynara cardunculus var. scolymus]|uniref:Glutathione S-transferase, C-terminal-like protein n=1 Tax=Cynara cardunculus var. scolymus TaxID=59895 RepID=A0A103XGU8_CYNCS|nr:Glutathione S-transferase, C-terminal-like protein [Cynara cardunculus var. scolymus]
MAVTFSDLHTETGVKSLESFLSGKTYISGNQITKDDVKVYAALLEKPSADLYPSASKWYDCVASTIASSFPGKAVGVSISSQAPSAEAAPVKEAAKEAAADDDDDLDLFDMKKLEEAVRSVELPGLLWGASKLVPVGYGIKKLTIMMTIVDDLVSVDTLIEERLTVEPINEYVQSCDIVAFNKI